MTAKRFYDWQTAGGADDVMRNPENETGSRTDPTA